MDQATHPVVGTIDRSGTSDTTIVAANAAGFVSTPAASPSIAASVAPPAGAVATATAKATAAATVPVSTSVSAPPDSAPVTAVTSGTAKTAAASSAAPAATTTAIPANAKSISAWVSCDGTSDDSLGVANAFAAAKNGAFTLLVDCPVRLHIGQDIARTIFIDSGTAVQFSGAGKFTVDNVFEPAFAIANSTNITLTNWNVEYDASLPVDLRTGGYLNNGQFVATNGNSPASAAFTNLRMTQWLTANRQLVFDNSKGYVFSMWVGPTNTSTVFYIAGDTSNVTVTGMRLYVPASAGGNRFIPMAFSLSANYKSNQTVDATTTTATQYVAVPHNLTFSNIDLDGTYMGWQGNAQNVTIDQVRSHRYGDLQDASGGNVGGVGKWFAPPHLFYFRYDITADMGLANKNIHLHDVQDTGPRIGVARDKGGSDTISGFAESLKIGGIGCSVDLYTSTRPDGFMDVLQADGLTISNVTATYNSDFTNHLYSSLRFPSPPYKNVTFQNVALTDLGATTTHLPIGTVTDDATQNMVLQNVKVTMNKWAETSSPIPTFAGTGDSIALDYTILSGATHIVSNDNQGLRVTLQATPSTIRVGEQTTLTWSARNSTSCSSSGAWNGAMTGNGSQALGATAPATLSYGFYCQNPQQSSSVQVPVVVLH